LSHNKMYREIEGYEDALYLSSEIKDELDNLHELIRYGESKQKINDNLELIHTMLEQIKSKVNC
jgi:hypothetical protein